MVDPNANTDQRGFIAINVQGSKPWIVVGRGAGMQADGQPSSSDPGILAPVNTEPTRK